MSFCFVNEINLFIFLPPRHVTIDTTFDFNECLTKNLKVDKVRN